MLKKIIQNKAEVSFLIFIIVLIQLFLLLNSPLADSYLINKSSIILDSANVSGDKINKIIKSTLNLLIAFLSIKQIGTVSAEETPGFETCCINAKDGSICQSGYSSDSNPLCDNPLPTPCKNVPDCSVGCCYDPEFGTCTTNAPKAACESNGGQWNSDKSCSISVCMQRGCIVGRNCFFETKKQCELQGGNFDKSLLDLECADFSLSVTEGACVYSNNVCRRKTSSECTSSRGDFYEGYLCSAEELGLNYTKEDHIGCVEGRDEIYWFDSAGNMENIYEGGGEQQKERSWNGGEILSKTESCSVTNGNINSETCGNCERPFSSCSATEKGKGVEDGDFVCKDLSCNDAPARAGETKDRLNGESWCIYDGEIGGGKDVVGSEHWLFSCIDGEVTSQVCGARRTGLCQESTSTDNGESFTTASCVSNEANACLMYNSDSGMEAKCNENPFCMIETIVISSDIYSSTCVPKYPMGSYLKDEEGDDENSCSLANTQCKVYYEYDCGTSKWHAIANQGCQQTKFAAQYQDFCISLGDCGNYVNYVGTGTNNVALFENGDKDGVQPIAFPWNFYSANAIPNPSDFIDSDKTAEHYYNAFADNMGSNVNWDKINYNAIEFNKVMKYFNSISGALGSLAGLVGAGVAKGAALGSMAGVAGSVLGGFSAALIGLSIGAVIGNVLVDSLHISGNAAITIQVLSMGAGLAISLSLYITFAVEGGAAGGPYGLIVAAVLIIIIVILIAVGCGKQSTGYVVFSCEQWQAPTGVVDCSRCNADPLKPCTEYRCNSIGQACMLLNEDEENPPCVMVEYEENPPIITKVSVPDEYSLNTDTFVDKKIKLTSSAQDGCIQEFTDLKVNFTTDERAQCKWSFEKSDNFDDMENQYPDNKNSFIENHSLTISLPSIESLVSNYDMQGDIRRFYGNTSLYIRCQDSLGNKNLDEYTIKFCVNTEPDRMPVDYSRVRTSPENGAKLPYGTKTQNMMFYVPKPAECRYSSVANTAYDQMKGEMSCNTDVIAGKTIYGWPCNTTINNLAEGENTFYIKCKAQPWLEGTENESQRAVNIQDYEYKLTVSRSPLIISSTSPKGKIKRGEEPASIGLNVITSGGIDKGKALCYYISGSYEILFQKTDSTSHIQEGWNVMSGDHLINIKCKDAAGNIALGNISFNLEADSKPPVVIRAFKQSGELTLLTDEDAKCYYDFNTCNFNIEDAQSMSIGFSTKHSVEWFSGQTYYIKCADQFDNMPSACSMIVEPSFMK